MIDRSIAPPINKISSIQLPSADVIALPNGARLHLLYNHNQPIIKLEIIFKAGKWFEPAPGVSFFTSKLLLEGSLHYTAKQIADLIAYYGASLECNTGFDRVSLTLYCLNKHLPNIIPLLKDVLSNPIFPEQEYQLLKKRTSQNITIEKQKNAYLATKIFTESIYGINHPYVTGLDETTVEVVQLDDVKVFFATLFSSSENEVFFSGDINNDNRDAIIELLNTVPTSSIPKNISLPIILDHHSPGRNLIREDQLQTTIRTGCLWPSMQVEEFPKLQLLNKILGGYFGSRLMKNIREDKGFTYGIFSTISVREQSSLFYIGTDINFQNSLRTVEEIKKEILLLQNELILDDELDTVKNYLIGKFINESNNIFDQVDKYKILILHNLPVNYYSNYLNEIFNTEAHELQVLARKYLILETFTQVLVGKGFE